jgi:hypothetical protein
MKPESVAYPLPRPGSANPLSTVSLSAGTPRDGSTKQFEDVSNGISEPKLQKTDRSMETPIATGPETRAVKLKVSNGYAPGSLYCSKTSGIGIL